MTTITGPPAASYQVAYVMPDQTRRIEATGLASVNDGRQLTAVLMPPVGYLRPDWVEILSSIGEVVDDGPVTELGGIAWASRQPDTPDPQPINGDPEAGGIDAEHGQPLALFDLEVA